MTRDEAVKKAEECFQFNVPGQEWFFTPLRLVAALENLGVLKFEEPHVCKECGAVVGSPADTSGDRGGK